MCYTSLSRKSKACRTRWVLQVCEGRGCEEYLPERRLDRLPVSARQRDQPDVIPEQQCTRYSQSLLLIVWRLSAEASEERAERRKRAHGRLVRLAQERSMS